MDVKQIYQIVNAVTTEVLGEGVVAQENLANIVDIGTAVFNANAVDAYTKALVDHIGKVIFVDRHYTGNYASLMVDGWTYGAVLEKIRAEMPEASENESWALNNGSSYDPNIFQGPTVSAKFYDKMTTFEVQMSFTDRQVRTAFSSAGEMNKFFSMIETAIQNSLNVKIDALAGRLVTNMIGETIHADYPAGQVANSSGVKAVNLLYLYNQELNPDTPLTAAQALYSMDFLKFAAMTIGKYSDRLTRMSVLFNIGATEKFSPRDKQHIILLSDFAKAADTYLQADTFHDEMTRLPAADIIPYWQGSGTDFALSATSKIDIVTAGGITIAQTGILGVIFDRDALMIANMDRRVTSNYNAKAEFTNYWHKVDTRYLADSDENFVVFFIA